MRFRKDNLKAFAVVPKRKILEMIDEGASNFDIVQALTVLESTMSNTKRNKEGMKRI